MFRRTGWLLRWVVVFALCWAALVYGLPWVRPRVPDYCARWHLQGGICSPGVQETLRRVQEWTDRNLAPLSRDARIRAAVQQAQSAFLNFETVLRRQVGNERVDAAFRGADVALGHVEKLLGDDREVAKEKLAAVPENARELLQKAREAFERLRVLLTSTGRRAEEVSDAVNEAKQALDALSTVLPETKK